MTEAPVPAISEIGQNLQVDAELLMWRLVRTFMAASVSARCDESGSHNALRSGQRRFNLDESLVY
jgi:hypothetical protein